MSWIYKPRCLRIRCVMFSHHLFFQAVPPIRLVLAAKRSVPVWKDHVTMSTESVHACLVTMVKTVTWVCLARMMRSLRINAQRYHILHVLNQTSVECLNDWSINFVNRPYAWLKLTGYAARRPVAAPCNSSVGLFESWKLHENYLLLAMFWYFVSLRSMYFLTRIYKTPALSKESVQALYLMVLVIMPCRAQKLSLPSIFLS